MVKEESDGEIEYKQLVIQVAKSLDEAEDIKQVDFNQINSFENSLKKIESKYKGKKYSELERVIDKVIEIIMSDDWESEGGTNFSRNTIKKVKDFVFGIMDYFSDQRIEFFPPKILPLLDGSLDVKWENNDFRLIINIPSEVSQLVEIYGDLKHSELEENNEIDCRVSYTIVKVYILEWLKKILRYGRKNQ